MNLRTTRRFSQLDVFADRPMLGNPLAVVHDAQGLSDEDLAGFARWTNLSETTFLLPPTNPAADYRVRIFTPTVELPFAGHPTLGSCHGWLSAGGEPHEPNVVVQECGVGLVRIRREQVADTDTSQSRLAFAAPPLRRSGALDEALVGRVAGMLQIARDEIVAHQHCDDGPGWVAVMLRSADAVRALAPTFGSERTLEIGVVGPTAAGPTAAGAPVDSTEPAFELRAFFPSPNGMCEDPVTGSLNAAVAQWLIGDGLAPDRYVAAQGTALGRKGRVFVERDGVDIWIGGHVADCIDGTVTM